MYCTNEQYVSALFALGAQRERHGLTVRAMRVRNFTLSGQAVS